MKLGKRLVAVLLACSLFTVALPCTQAAQRQNQSSTVAGLEGPYSDEELTQLVPADGGKYYLTPGTTLYYKLRSSAGNSVPMYKPLPQFSVTEITNDGVAVEPELSTAGKRGHKVWTVKVELIPFYGEEERTYKAQLQIDGYSETISFIAANRTVPASSSFWVDNEAPLVLFDKYESQKQVVNMYVGDVAEVTLQAFDQKPVYMGYSTENDWDIVEQYIEQNLQFVNFPGQPEFEYPASVKLLAKEGWVLYERTETGFRKIETRYVDNGLVFETQKLTSYLISDGELGSKAHREDVDGGESDEQLKNNPFTGH